MGINGFRFLSFIFLNLFFVLFYGIFLNQVPIIVYASPQVSEIMNIYEPVEISLGKDNLGISNVFFYFTGD